MTHRLSETAEHQVSVPNFARCSLTRPPVIHSLLLIGAVLFSVAVHAADGGVAVTTYFPANGLGPFLARVLDLATFRNSLGPRRDRTHQTFARLGITPTTILPDAVAFDSDEWFYQLRVIRRADINGDGLEDLELCFTDRAKKGSYSAQQPLLVTRYSASSYAVALKYEVEGCPHDAR